jgi:CP family cyanate transporter-like MFS transporter
MAVLGMVLVAFNQRLAVASVPPILHELGLGAGAQSALVTIPVLCFGLGALAGPRMRRAWGQEGAVFVLVALLAAAIAVRAAFLGWVLFPTTIVIGLCIANLNVLMPSFVKQRFPDRPGPMTSAYVASATLGPALAAGLTVPVFHAFGGSAKAALGIWAAPAVLALIVWTPQLWAGRRLALAHGVGSDGNGSFCGDFGDAPAGATPADRRPAAPGRPIWRHSIAWQVMVYMGVGSLVFYGPLSWVPQIYQSRGVDATTAGYLLLVMNFVGMIGSAFAPLLMRRRPDVRLGVVVFAVVVLVGFTGLLLGPNSTAFLWMAIVGLGTGAQFGLALLLIVIRAADGNVAARLSAMSQSGGYLIAALGPLLMGALHSLTGGWSAPILFLIVANIFGLALGYYAARERVIAA